ncbi:hypothetical protein AC578_6884 [Pseudocercospora eumusae]|uniref:Uncharacterized protein n=1 Tax=Pseudocercospora eumusae TaxID=321146 RepID=A0A139H9X4_9PEZI|nr:hypothetical protein AC578_6884 [Pseudocercospora eumusae]
MNFDPEQKEGVALRVLKHMMTELVRSPKFYNACAEESKTQALLQKENDNAMNQEPSEYAKALNEFAMHIAKANDEKSQDASNEEEDVAMEDAVEPIARNPTDVTTKVFPFLAPIS